MISGVNFIRFVPVHESGHVHIVHYQIQVDSKHNVWTNLWSTDKVARYEPSNGQWTLFDLPNRGSEARYIAIAERDGKLEVILPYYRTRKVAVMTFRSEAELAALKAQAERQ